MKIFLLIFVLIFPSTVFGEWEKLSFSPIGETYIDMSTYKEVDGFFYIWFMNNYKKPIFSL